MEGVPLMVNDIEDLGGDHPLPSDRVRVNSIVPKRVSKRRMGGAAARPIAAETVGTAVEADGADSKVPGTEKIYVRTWGCGHNNSDGEYMAGLLAAYGYGVTNEPGEADLWVLNSCAVKAPSEHAFNNMIEKGQVAGKKLVLAGCVPQGESRSKSKTSGMSVVGVQQIDRVVEVVEQTLRGNMVRLMTDKKVAGKKEGGASLSLPKIRRNPLVEIIPINTGCLNQCTYCKTKHARGDLGSYSVGAIMDRVREVISEGVVEIWLTSEDTGAYGRDIGTNIVELLTAILGAMPEGTMLRLGMTNPPYILEHVEAMARLLQHPRMYCYLHVPVQAGSDEILYAMRREYTQEDFRHVVDSVRAGAPGVTIATDIIAGFPGETDGDFEETYQLCKEYEFPCLYINQFFSRPGTPAAAMEKCDTKMVKGRTKRLTELFRSYFPHKEKVGNVYTVLAAEESTDKKFYVAHNKCYDQILVPKRDELLGRVFDVKVTEAGKFHMIGEVIEESLARSPPRRTPLAQGAISGSKGKGSRSTAPHMMRKGGLPALAGQATTEPPPAGTCCGGAGAKADGGGCCGGMGKPSASSAAAADRAESSAGCCGGAGSKPAGGACCGGAKKAPTSTDPTTLRNRKATPLQLASEQDALPSAEITPAVAVATARLLTFDRKALLATAFVVLALDLCRIAVNYYVYYVA